MGLTDKETKRRLREFLTADVQFNPDWTAFLIQQAKLARSDKSPGWEGSANANFVSISKEKVLIEPLFNQYPESLEISPEDFIDMLQAWMDQQNTAQVARKKGAGNKAKGDKDKKNGTQTPKED